MGDPSVDSLVASEPVRTIGSLQYRRLARPGYLVVQYSGRVADIETAEAWFEDLDQALRDANLTSVLWDSTAAQGHPPDVRERIWRWLEEATVIECSAIIVQSEMLRLSANLSGLGTIKMRGFSTFEDADAWLTGGAR